MREFAIGRFLFLGQGMKLRALGRDLAVFMQLVYSNIRRIAQAGDLLHHARATVFEQSKVMLTALPKICRHNQLCFLVHDQLGFLGMPFLLSAVVPTLLFFGRSMGCSVASINTISINVSLACKALRPGSRNSPDFISTFSTFRIVRHTVDSLTP